MSAKNWTQLIKRSEMRGKPRSTVNEQQYEIHKLHFGDQPSYLNDEENLIRQKIGVSDKGQVDKRLFKKEIENVWYGHPALLRQIPKDTVRPGSVIKIKSCLPFVRTWVWVHFPRSRKFST